MDNIQDEVLASKQENKPELFSGLDTSS
jgi:hypothetical protein